MMRGQNLPGFRAAQLEFTAHIRNPDVNPRPEDIEQRRMDIYLGLFYRNIESFITSAFPILKSCLDSKVWDDLIREFVHTHASESPYFLEISQEFLAFIDARGLKGLPVFALELAHYEWVELALDVAPAEIEFVEYADADAIPEALALSPLALPLTYAFAVHQIGPEHQPESPSARGCYLIAYRQANDVVKFMESNPLTHRLLDLLAEAPVRVASDMLHGELSAAGSQVSREDLEQQIEQILRRLLNLSVVVERAVDAVGSGAID